MSFQIDENKIKDFRKSIIKWGKISSSSFPWRKTHNKWHALVSEIMLQRTNANQVLPVYKEFCKKYKKPEDLLKCKRERLFKKLGLHWREKQIIKLTEFLVEKDIPESKDNLLKLPGIGNYIASAYRSLHLGIRDVLIDSNIVRIFGKYFGFETDGETRRKEWFIQFADKLTPERKFKEYNYALLDFSRVICAPKSKCELCILSNKCKYLKR
jgi:A/G-specific adenine glycosylase